MLSAVRKCYETSSMLILLCTVQNKQDLLKDTLPCLVYTWLCMWRTRCSVLCTSGYIRGGHVAVSCAYEGHVAVSCVHRATYVEDTLPCLVHIWLYMWNAITRRVAKMRQYITVGRVQMTTLAG